jgi:hypothetical protein
MEPRAIESMPPAFQFPLNEAWLKFAPAVILHFQ